MTARIHGHAFRSRRARSGGREGHVLRDWRERGAPPRHPARDRGPGAPARRSWRPPRSRAGVPIARPRSCRSRAGHRGPHHRHRSETPLYRPPVGQTNPRIVRAAEELDLTLVGWSVRARDGIKSNPERVVGAWCRASATGPSSCSTMRPSATIAPSTGRRWSRWSR